MQATDVQRKVNKKRTSPPPRRPSRLAVVLAVAAVVVIAAAATLLTWTLPPATSGDGAEGAERDAGSAIVHDDAGNVNREAANAIVHDDAGYANRDAVSAVIHDDAGYANRDAALAIVHDDAGNMPMDTERSALYQMRQGALKNAGIMHASMVEDMDQRPGTDPGKLAPLIAGAGTAIVHDDAGNVNPR